GRTFTRLYREWMDSLRTQYGVLADSLGAVGVTQPEPLTTHGYRARHPRFSPDGSRVAYAVADGRSVARTRVIGSADGHELRATRRNTLAALAWTPDGGIVTSQLEWQHPYRFVSDLVLIDAHGREHRLTEGARLQDPDVARDGRRIVAVANDAGLTGLVLLDFDGARVTGTRTLVPPEAGVQWALPRFAPGGAPGGAAGGAPSSAY